MADEIRGVIKQDGSPAEADLYLVDLSTLPTVASDDTTGEYVFTDPGDGSVIPDSETIYILAKLGATLRVMTHGPVVPVESLVELWTPAELMTALWLDGADLISSEVALWEDKSGNGNNAIQGANYRPGVTTVNGLNAVLSDGIDDFLVVPHSSDLDYAAGVSIFYVSSVNVNGRTFGKHPSSTLGTSADSLFASPATLLSVGGAYEVVDVPSVLVLQGGIFDGEKIARYRDGYTIAPSSPTGGTVSGNYIYPTNTVTDNTSDLYLFKRDFDGSESYGGFAFCEFVWCKGAITNDARQLIEGYLAHKWGLESNLPSDHPYKTDAPVIVEYVDDWWEHVVLRLTFDGTDGSTTITDSSNSSHTITAYGNAQLDTAQFRNGTAACYFDGTSDTVLSIPHSVDLEFHTGDFTIELWFYRVASIEGAAVSLLGKWDAGVSLANTSWALYFENGMLYFGVRKDSDNSFYGFAVASGLVDEDFAGWVHLAIVRSGQYLRLFKNGVGYTQAGPITLALNSGTLPLIIGGFGSFADRGSYLAENNCYIDDLRITKGHARYTSDFIPPKRQLPIAAPEAVGDEHWASVSLLLSMNGTNGGTTFTDSSPTPKTITRYGNTCTKTDQWRFGGASAYFDGSGDYLTTNSILLPATGDFTLEMWIYRTAALSESKTLACQRDVTSYNDGRFYFQVPVDNTIRISIGGSSAVSLSSTATIALNSWHHIAATRQAGVFRVFVDGVLEGEANSPDTSLEQYAAFSIGAYPDGTGSWPGYIDDLRVTSGVARYTADFTPPVRNFPNFGV